MTVPDNDADCDGVTASADCDDTDPTNTDAKPADCPTPPVAEPYFGITVTSGTAAIFDPIPCGGQFSGTITGGTPPYTLAYTATATTPINLGSFTVAAEGTFTAPDGFINYATFAAGNYIVDYTATDANGRVLSGNFAAAIAGNCDPAATTVATTAPAAATPATPVPAAAPAAGAATSELAHTGTTTTTLAMIALGFLGAGLPMISYRRMTNVNQPDAGA